MNKVVWKDLKVFLLGRSNVDCLGRIIVIIGYEIFFIM